MVDKNIRFREASRPELVQDDHGRIPGSIFKYNGLTYYAVERYVVGEVYLCYYDCSRSFRADHLETSEPQIFQAIRAWSQGGYGEMSLAEFLNATVPE